MKAVGLYRYLPIADPEALVDLDLPNPTPTGRDLLVRVRAVSVNPVDTKVRSPREGTEQSPRVLGWDAAGVVEAAGPECSLFEPGDEVFYAGSIIRPGCNSELHLVDERIVGRKPSTLDFAGAAALPLTAITAWEALFDRLKIPRDGSAAGRSVLIVGGAGGVGSIAMQIAKKVAGLTVIATASRPESREWCVAHGADLVIDHTGELDTQLDSEGLDYVDYALCLNDLEGHFEQLAEAVAPQGMICSIVGASTPLEMGALFDKSIGLVWELMFTRSRYQTDDMIEQHRLLEEVASRVDSGTLSTTLTRTLSPVNAETLREAHRLIEGGHTIGKIVIEGF